MSLDTDKVEVSLVTDWANNHEGFRMTYKTSGEMNTTPAPTSPVSSTEGTITSEGTTGIKDTYRKPHRVSSNLLAII